MKLFKLTTAVALVAMLGAVQFGCSSDESTNNGSAGSGGQNAGGSGGQAQAGNGGQAQAGNGGSGGSAGQGGSQGGQGGAQGGSAGSGGAAGQGGSSGSSGASGQGGQGGVAGQGGSAGSGGDADAGPACTPEGQKHAVSPSAPKCCPGLKAISLAAPDKTGQCPSQPPIGSVVCTKCGDGKCGLGENYCNCPADCKATTLPDGGACTPEGKTRAISPSVPPCCPGLTGISTASPDQNGKCPTRPPLGAEMCAACGDGQCGPGENKCNCAKDCP